MVYIAVLIMVKNESKRIRVTLDSIKNFADCVVVYDTGSEDDTVNIIETYCNDNNLKLRIKTGIFTNFAESRNTSLDFADSFNDIDYILLLDTNDELKNGDKLREFCTQNMDHVDNTAFLVCQEWWSGYYDRYYNVRLIKARSGWRYMGSVHEYMKNNNTSKPVVDRVDDEVVIFQDRTKDDNKTSKRFVRDKQLLLEDHYKNPEEPRTLFYLAQTCACLDELEDALYYYKLRSYKEGFQEEKFHAFLRIGDTLKDLGNPWYICMEYYMKSFEHSKRVEPLIRIAKHYKDIKQWELAYSFINLACNLEYPKESILFVDKLAYDYERWHLLGIIGYYSKNYEHGKLGCIKALEFRPESAIDKSNLNYYNKMDL